MRIDCALMRKHFVVWCVLVCREKKNYRAKQASSRCSDSSTSMKVRGAGSETTLWIGVASVVVILGVAAALSVNKSH